jgi:CHAT domain-containing protein/tetratricopeptide (TPR) repeat protein
VLPKSVAASCPELIRPRVLHLPVLTQFTSVPSPENVAGRKWRRSAGAVLVCVLAGCEAGATAELADALETAPGVAPRLSAASAFRACTERVPVSGTIPRATCGSNKAAGNSRLAKLARHAAQARDDPASLHTLAILDLVANDERGKALDRSIAVLERLAILSDHPAPVLADLAAALIVRSERTQAPRDLLEAYEAAEEAVSNEPRNLAALYNRALALDRFGLVDEVASAWEAYLAVDSATGWADEARRRRRVAVGVHAPAAPAPDAPLPIYTTYAAADPQGARELGMDRLLAEWGEAIQAGDAARAEDRLRRAHALGWALERRPGGDASLADMVRAIRAAEQDPGAMHNLARAHQEFAGGRRIFEALEFQQAEARFTAAGKAAVGSPSLASWTQVFLGLCRVQLNSVPEGLAILAEAASADSARYPALVGRARWPLGRVLGQTERWDRGLQETTASARLFAHSGERANEGSALNILAEIRFVVGEPDSGYAAIHSALNRLRPYRASLRLHNLLAALGGAAASDGLDRSAGRIFAEGVGVAARNGNPFLEAEARLKRARHLAATGSLGAAQADVDVVRALVAGIDAPGARAWVEAQLSEAEAVVSLRANPGRAAQAFDSAAAFFVGRQFPFHVLPALIGGAQARLASGDTRGSLERLEAAFLLLDQRRDSLRMEPRRAAVFDATRTVVDQLVLLTLADGRPYEALRYMDDARASLAASGGRREMDRNGYWHLAEEAVVEYARIADTLLTWSVTSGRVSVARTVLDTIQLARLVQELEVDLERGASATELRPGLSRLYEWLIRPVQSQLAPGTPIVVVADGEIASVPFGALYDVRRARYLIEDHSLRFTASLREAARRPATEVIAGVVLVTDPEHDPREHPLLDPLSHAREEVRAIERIYRGAAVLQGADVTRGAVEAALARAGVLHFAGHAVFDDHRPERSYLVLAPEAGQPSSGKITAAEVAGLDLRRVQLVVLSACRTVRSGRTRAAGFTGLSGALLAAGAAGTIGSTWDVNDRSTAALMVQFHRAYEQGRDGPRALQIAQLALLRSGDGSLRTPAAWAGFRYSGR